MFPTPQAFHKTVMSRMKYL